MDKFTINFLLFLFGGGGEFIKLPSPISTYLDQFEMITGHQFRVRVGGGGGRTTLEHFGLGMF